jgi:acyl transferase domain-containing protein/acyl carrier protein
MMSQQREPLAIIGLGCRFPGRADSPEAFWRMLCAGVDAICDVPADRWDIRKFYDPDPASPGRTYTRQAGFLCESIWEFDPTFFGISPREAAVMDPQQRLLLETTWEAFEHAGLPLDDAQRRRIGVYVGAFCFDNAIQQLSLPSREAIFSNSATAASMVMLSNRISYAFDLQGPSLTVDTACSSSLVATHLACQALWDGDCDLAVVAGVNVMLRPESTILECKGGFLSKDARCRAFDAAASGYARGEGAGVVIVRPLAAAQAAGDQIIALIRGSGVNHDGRTAGITVPNGSAQEALIRQVCVDASIAPGDIGCVESHGTGTPVGDPIEANALGRVIGQARIDAPIWVGSVKTNIGHLEAGAGIAGLMKAALCLAHQQMPPHLHLVAPNPNIDFAALGLRIPTRVEPLSAEQGRFAAVNSFGYGGTNAHIILERASEPDPLARAAEATPAVTTGRYLLPLSARSDAALASFAATLADQVAGYPDRKIAAFGHALAVRRVHHSHRAAIIAADGAEFIARLRQFAKGSRDPTVRTGRAVGPVLLAWVYTGMGTQWWGMGRSLYAASAVFRTAIQTCDDTWRAAGGEALLPLFDGGVLPVAHGSAMPEPRDAQPANLALQVGITEMLRALGLAADAIVGHSVGEIGAAWAAGALSLGDAFKLTYHRCHLQQEQLGRGTMLALATSAQAARAVILELGPDVEIAAFNDHSAVTLGGPDLQLARIATWAESNGVKARRLQVGVAYHSRQMNPMRERFLAALAGLKPTPPRVPMYSTVTGSRIVGAEHTPAYWWRNAREPVLLVDALDQLRDEGYTVFLEVGPQAVLGESIRRMMPGATICASQRRGNDEILTLLGAVADCYCAGVALDWRRLYPHGDPALRSPRYPFQRERLWQETAGMRADRLVEELHPLLHQRLPGPWPAWQTTLNERFQPWLPDHKVGGVTIFPGAGYAVAALAAAAHDQRGNAVENLAFERAFGPRPQTQLRIELDPSDGRTTISSLPPDNAATWQLNATARLPEGTLPPRQALDLTAVRTRCATAVDVDALYRRLAALGLEYGSGFRCIREMNTGLGQEALVALDCGDPGAARYLLHPALLDGAIQAMTGIAFADGQDDTYVPTHIRSLRVHAPIGSRALAHVLVTHVGGGSIHGEICLVDDAGTKLAEAEGVRCQRVSTGRASALSVGRLYAWCWESIGAAAAPARVSRPWLAIAESAALLAPLRAAAAAVAGLTVDISTASELADRIADRSDWAGVLDLRALAADGRLDPTGEAACMDLLTLAQTLLAAGVHAPEQLAIITNGAVPAGDTPVNPAAGAVWGLGRVIMTEHPALGAKLIDVDNAVDLGALLIEIAAPRGATADNEIALRGHARYAPRLDRWRPAPEEPTACSLENPLRLELGTPGVLGSFRWIRDERRPPGRDQVEIRVHTASLNFKDLMKAMNMLSADYLRSTFIGEHVGMECAGIVVAVGENVRDYQVGDEVIAIDTGGCFRSYHTVWTGYTAHKPKSLSFAEAPSLIAYVTPYYAMKYVAKVQPGETVLIHSASGGVGQAAIQIARNLGADIIVTAGSEAKRAFLRRLGIAHVFDSRSLAFVDSIRAITGGRGVDVIINSLSGEAARQSLALLAPYGRFVEIGKKDIATGHTLELSDFDRNLMYVAVDTDRMGREKPALFRKLIDEVLAMLETSELVPITTQMLLARDAEEAFRTMARAAHVGKIVLDLSAGEVPAAQRRGAAFRTDHTWLITGGLGGFGLAVARWLVEQGVRHLVLAGRTAASRSAARAAVAEMAARGVQIDAVQLDVTDRAAVDALIARISAGPAPLQGVIHAAMVLDDAAVANLDAGRLAAVMRPKALGAWHLHQATKGLVLDAFVLFSSLATYIGNAGQAAYVAANGFLDALAWHRHSLGLPALTINWSAIADAGVVERSRATAAYLETMGILGLPVTACTNILGELLDSGAIQVGVADVAWARWAAASGNIARSPRFSRLVVPGADGAVIEPAAVSELRALSEPERLQRLALQIRDRLARVMHQDSMRIDMDLALDNMGVDSLMGVELITALGTELGLQLSGVAMSMGDLTVTKLAEQVLGILFSAKLSAPREAVDVDAMSEAELDLLLAAGDAA